MSVLSKSDAEKMISVLHTVYAETDVQRVMPAILSAVSSLISADAAGLNFVHDDGHVQLVTNAPYLSEVLEKRLWALAAYIHQHPLQKLFDETGTTEPVKLSDFLTRRELHRLDLYQEFYLHIDVEHQMCVYLQETGKLRLALNLNRSGGDFTRRDLTILRHISAHLLQAYKNAEAFSRLSRRAQMLDRAPSAHRQGFIYLNADGSLLEMTTLCSQWLSQYFHDYRSGGGLPESLRRWIHDRQDPSGLALGCRRPLVRTSAHGKLTVRLAVSGEERVLLLSEQPVDCGPGDLKSLPLLRRERDVLFWMAQGKSNPEIAAILGISPRTVHKHNENIFRKLDVEGRHGAVLIALELLGT